MFDFFYDLFFGSRQWIKYVAVTAGFLVSEILVIAIFGPRISGGIISIQLVTAFVVFSSVGWVLTRLPGVFWYAGSDLGQSRAPELETVGIPSGQGQVRGDLLHRLETDANLLDYKVATLEAQFRRDLENWLMWPVSQDVLPHELQHDSDNARALLVGAVSGLASVAALTGWTFMSLHFSVWYGVFGAILATQVLDAILLNLFTDHELPQFAVRALRRLVLVPSAVLFAIANATALLLRYSIDAKVAPIVAAAVLWVAVMSLMFVTAALQVNVHMLRWSARFERKWLKLRRLSQRNRNVLHLMYQHSTASATVKSSRTTEVATGENVDVL
jgi:hypothetical protein